MTDMIVANGIPDFGATTVRQPIPFKIDGEVFYVAGSQPAGILFDLAEMSKSQTIDVQVVTITRLLQGMLVPESYDRFSARMRSASNPITIEEILALLRWTMEQYADRPTTPPSSSSADSYPSAPTSMVGAPATA